MGRFQCKVLFMLVLYGAGFATAMYLMAPSQRSGTGHDQAAMGVDRTSDGQPMRAELLAASCQLRLGMNKLISFAEEKTAFVADFIRQKWADHEAAGG